MNIEKQLGELVDVCDVCGVSLEDYPNTLTREYGGKVQTFCSEKCYKEYLENPELYAEFPGDEGVE